MERRPIQVTTNSFEITALPREPYFHFDEITPSSVIKNRNYEIIGRLVADNATTFNPRPVYDGRKNLFCKRDIPSGSYDVCMRRDRSRGPTHSVVIKRVSIIDPRDVQKLTRRREHGDNTEQNAMSLNLLQLIVRQAANMRHRFPEDARSFYVETNSRDLGIGLSAWRGYFQSVRPTMGRLIVNIDVSHAMIYTPSPLIDTMFQVLDVPRDRRNVRDLQDLDRAKMTRLRTFLKGVHIVPTVSPRMRSRPISDLVVAAALQEFDKDGERITVKKHFESKYNVQVRFPQLLGVRIGRTAIIPAEFCKIVPGQVYRKKITSPHAQKAFLEFATQKPDVRINMIANAVRDGIFDYATSDFMRDAGMNIGTSPMGIQGHLLQPPPIKYGPGSQPQVPDKGAWNVVGKRFLRPGKLANWGAVVFDNRANPQQVQTFVSTLVRNMTRLGMSVPLTTPPISFGKTNGGAVEVEKCLNAAGEEMFRVHGRSLGEPQLLLIFLPSSAADIRRAVKHWGDCKRGVITQCIKAGKWERCNDQYCNNVALKINARIGGTNSSIDVPQVHNHVLKDSMIIGADVGHPAPGMKHRPSVTGLVATVDPDVSIMASAASVQRPRLEIIQDLQQMIMTSLTAWRQWRANNIPGYRENQVPPRKIIFYRDGVSEGEYAQVIQHEIPLIKEAFRATGMPENLWPKVLFIVVGKRHHVRFFPQHPRDADRSGNCPAGLLVDREITNPHYEDFYLQSHGGLLGTSRPSHYVILQNETSLTKEQVQTVTFHLCHTYASATRSVSIPAPVYYADKICSRLEFHCEDGASLSDTASNVTGGTPEFDLDYWRGMFKESKLAKSNYFL